MKPLLFALLATTIISCHKEKPESHIYKKDSLTYVEPDSVALEKYFNWQKGKPYRDIAREPLDTLALKHIESNRNEVLLDDFVAASDSLKSRFYDNYTPEKLKQYLYTIDFNGDTLDDIIYYGPSGSEGSIVHFFLTTPDGFVNVFTQRQILQKPVLKNGKLISFTIYNPGCCAEFEVAEYNYTIDYNNNTPAFTLKNTIGYINYYQKPEKMFSKEIPFSVRTATTILRPEGYILKAEHPLYSENGNEIATYPKGHKGKALARFSEHGIDWLYVKMEPTKAEKGYPDTFHQQPTSIYGWILKTDTDMK
ncbi:hypothetical protein ACLI1A_12950 [Flavobacterium sp. RHBU_3]|uniref:hypothetical protein n=1 Tax=Flavobacterium sp. RHBU_3 TaxID=3391184 RepID=UPI0039847B38